MIAAVIVIILLVAYLLVNNRYKRSNAYKNQQIELQNYRNGVPEHIKYASFGSTYGFYAFDQMSDMVPDSFNFCLPGESLEGDRLLVNHYINHLEEGATVFLNLAACVPFFRYSMSHNEADYYKLLPLSDIPNHSPLKAFKYYLVIRPNKHGIKNCIRAFIDTPVTKRLSERYPEYYNLDFAEKQMKGMADGWINLFHLNDLKRKTENKENDRNLEYNTRVLLDICTKLKQRKAKVYFVIPPFSRILNQYFGDEFITSGLYKMIGSIPKELYQEVLDLRKGTDYQNDFSCFYDGGFRLSKRGSQKFLKQIFMRLSDGIDRKDKK